MTAFVFGGLLCLLVDLAFGVDSPFLTDFDRDTFFGWTDGLRPRHGLALATVRSDLVFGRLVLLMDSEIYDFIPLVSVVFTSVLIFMRVRLFAMDLQLGLDGTLMTLISLSAFVRDELFPLCLSDFASLPLTAARCLDDDLAHDFRGNLHNGNKRGMYV